MPPMPRKRGPPTALRIDTPVQNPHIAVAFGESPASALSSAASEYDPSPFNTRPPSRNMKRLSLTLPSAHSSSNSLALPPSEPASAVSPGPSSTLFPDRPRRPSIISLPTTAGITSTLLHRKDEEGSPTAPYVDGPIQIIPGVWLGSEENARDWKGLIERGIKSILNVAKEVASPFDTAQPTRRFVSTPNLKQSAAAAATPTHYPAHLASGRPSMHYLKLQWSHGQQDLVEQGFPSAMTFTDAALERGEGVLIHCQCGISRSATMVIALVMRAAAQQSTSVPPEIWELKGYQGAYSFVKEKSKWVGPNMSLIYQLLEYERTLKPAGISSAASDDSAAVDEEEEWGRRRQMMEEAASDHEEDERESSAVMREAQALDKAMEDRIVARKSSASSMSSSGVGMGPAWRSRYSSRKRTGSISSNLTNGSILSEDLVEEDEEQELLGVGGGFDGASVRRRSPSLEDGSSESNSPAEEQDQNALPAKPFTPLTARGQFAVRPPPSAPVWKTSFSLPPPPATATKAAFNLPPVPLASKLKAKRRPPPIGILPPVPSSPIKAVAQPVAPAVPSRLRTRTESRKPAPPPLHLRSTLKVPFTPLNKLAHSTVSTPSQTLFVFPPETALTARTPSTMTLTTGPVPFPTISTPRVATFRSHGRTRSYIGLGAPPTPTTACSIVDARGWVGLE